MLDSFSRLVSKRYRLRLAGAGIALAAGGVLALSVATAQAATLQCGDTVTQDTIVENDIVCTDPAAAGVVIGADNITVRFRKHSIIGAGSTGSGSVGIVDDGAPHTGVTVRDATIDGFDTGIDLQTSTGNVWGMTFTATDVGLILTGNDNYVLANRMASAGTIGFAIQGDNNFLYGNRVTGLPDDGIAVSGDNPRLVRNRVTGCSFDGIAVRDYTTLAKVVESTVSGCATGITLAGQNGRVHTSDVSGNCDGIFVADTTAIVWGNSANDNYCGAGIRVGVPGVTVRDNTANRNQIGIDAAEGTIDRGGNTASGNTVAECFVVVCTPSLVP